MWCPLAADRASGRSRPTEARGRSGVRTRPSSAVGRLHRFSTTFAPDGKKILLVRVAQQLNSAKKFATTVTDWLTSGAPNCRAPLASFTGHGENIVGPVQVIEFLTVKK